MTPGPHVSPLPRATTRRRVGRITISLLTTLLGATGCYQVVIDPSSMFSARPGPAADSAAMVAALPAGYTLARLSIPVASGVDLTGVAATRPDAISSVLFLGGEKFRVATDGATTLRALTGAAPVNVVLLDYPGTGTSTGAPTLASITAYARTAYDWIVARPKLAPPGGLIVHGDSFGGFVATSVAESRSVRGLVLQGAPTTLLDWKKEASRPGRLKWWARPAHPFMNIKIDDSLSREDNRVRLGHYRGPVLVLVGEDDAVTPPTMARSLVAASASPRELRRLVVLPGSDHQSVMSNPGFGAVYRAFLDSVVPVARAPNGR